jgi:hypothetical protein
MEYAAMSSAHAIQFSAVYNEQNVSRKSRMYSMAGASFQEWALRLLDHRGSVAHRSIGRFVSAINNGRMTIGQAEAAYMALLGG